MAGARAGRGREQLWFAAAVLLGGAFHLPSLGTGYVSDDARLSLAPGEALARGIDMAELAGEYFDHFLSIGRFFPLALSVLFGFAAFPTLLGYKLAKLASLMAVLGLWGALVQRLTRSPALAIASVLLCAVLFQYRLYHDPVISFGWQLPQAMAFFLGGLHVQLGAPESRRPWVRSIASAALFSASFLTYEVMLPLVLVHLALAEWRGRVRAALTGVAPHLVAALAFAATLAAMRLTSPPPSGPQTDVSLDPVAMVVLVLHHALAAAPLSYLAADASRILDARSLELSAGALLLAAGIVALARHALGRSQETQPARLPKLLVVGALLLVLPSLVIAPSAKYQREVALGVGYLPVFVGVFGASACITAGLAWALRRFPNDALRLAAALAIGGLALIGYQRNAAAAEVLAEQWRHPRRALEEALARGVLDPALEVWVASGSPDCPWQVPALFRMHAGFAPDIVYSVAPPEARLAVEPSEGSPDAPQRLVHPLAYLAYGVESERLSAAIAGEVEALVRSPSGAARPVSRRARVSVQGPTGAGAAATFDYFRPVPTWLHLHYEEVEVVSGRTAPRERWLERGAPDGGLAPITSGSDDDWQLWELRASAGHALLLDSVRVSALP